VPVFFRQSVKARHYTIYVRHDGNVTVTIPRRGSLTGARRFLESRRAWVARTLRRFESSPMVPKRWLSGTEILLRGKPVPLRVETSEGQHAVYLAAEFCGWSANGEDLRPIVEPWLQNLAAVELTRRVRELAEQNQSPVRRVSIRAQRSRWGSCSVQGTVSLNWRLVQIPIEVRDYVILHELMHLREMNHSRQFWRNVAQVCPDYKQHDLWLKSHGRMLAF
jgi:predicted metal-dependent hydrolase